MTPGRGVSKEVSFFRGRKNLRTFLHVPVTQLPPARFQKLARQLAGAFLTPVYWLLAHRYHTPGLRFHRLCAEFGLRLLFKRAAPISLGWSYQFIFEPMDSTRYFEFDFAWRALEPFIFQSYLDVSSPRLLPLLLLWKKRVSSAELINPDTHDLETTQNLADASGLANRCHFRDCVIGAVPFALESFDLITSISVVEHISEDRQAIQKMWALLKPGGRLLVTVPCAAQTSEQFVDHNEYGVLEPDKTGFVFFQRFYDPTLLQERILSVTGPPNQMRVFGEKVPGAFQKNAQQKRMEHFTRYPFWREPYMMGQEYTYFDSVANLPGEGVIAMEFVKP